MSSDPAAAPALWRDLRTWTLVYDKATQWGPGEWADEPDLATGTDPATELPCLAIRNTRSGAWRGYVGIAKGHPLHRVDYRDERVGLIAHGQSVTFSDHYIKHAGQPFDTWWFGFHCAGFHDIEPGRDARDRAEGYPVFRLGIEEYRTLAYVQSECVLLADQLAKGSSS
jgi:hypothetical protein